MRKRMIAMILLAVMVISLIPEDTWAGWTYSEEGTSYVTSEGVLTGLVKIGNASYFFNKYGLMKTGVRKWHKKYYFFSLTDGKMQYGWIHNGTKTYYANEKTGVLYRNKKLGSFYFGSDCTLQTNSGSSASSWVKLNGKKYYYDASLGSFVTGAFVINNKTYYFDEDGVLQTSQWVSIDGYKYYVGKKGYVLTSRWVDSKNYYVTADGKRAKGFVTIGGSLYFFRLKSGKVRKGCKFKVDGKYYYAASDGKIYQGALFKVSTYVYYYASEDGVLATGLTKVGNNLYYFDETKCSAVLKSLVKVDGDSYYFLKNGKAAMNRWVRIKKKYYYFLEDGKMAKNQFIGTNYYVGSNGVRVEASYTLNETGVVQIDGENYIIDSTGHAVIRKWVKIDGNKYRTDSDGLCLTGLQEINGKQYLFDSDGILLVSTTSVIGSIAYTTNSKGIVISESTDMGSAIASYGQEFVGNPYVYGGTSLTNGADCSGFVQSIFLHFGIKLLRTADEQMDGPSQTQISLGYKKGTQIKNSQNLLPGDLVFYGSTGWASHVAIYIGNDQIVHAANSKRGIIVTSITWPGTPVKYMRYWN